MNKTKIISALAALTLCSTAVFSVAAVGPIKNTEDTTKPVANKTAVITNVDSKKIKTVVKFEKHSIKKVVGKEFNVNAQINRAGEKITYHSSDEKIAVVDKDGNVITKSLGKVDIIATCKSSKDVCCVNVVKPVGNNIKDSTMASIASNVGKQTDYAYSSSTIMCSAYSFAYAYQQVKGEYLAPGSVWYAGGCTWTGGTYRKYGSASEMLNVIKSQLDDNKACVGLLSGNGGTHYVTFYKYTGNGTTLSDFTVVDPWDGVIKNASSFGYNSYHVVTID